MTAESKIDTIAATPKRVDATGILLGLRRLVRDEARAPIALRKGLLVMARLSRSLAGAAPSFVAVAQPSS